MSTETAEILSDLVENMRGGGFPPKRTVEQVARYIDDLCAAIDYLAECHADPAILPEAMEHARGRLKLAVIQTIALLGA